MLWERSRGENECSRDVGLRDNLRLGKGAQHVQRLNTLGGVALQTDIEGEVAELDRHTVLIEWAWREKRHRKEPIAAPNEKYRLDRAFKCLNWGRITKWGLLDKTSTPKHIPFHFRSLSGFVNNIQKACIKAVIFNGTASCERQFKADYSILLDPETPSCPAN
jgi:hypothetical protein